jgi:hypothetical protein
MTEAGFADEWMFGGALKEVDGSLEDHPGGG